jgi:dienelactone hydrolase
LDFLLQKSYVKKDQIYAMGRSNAAQTVLNLNDDIYKKLRQNFFAGVLSLYPLCRDRIKTTFMKPMGIFVAALDDANPPKFCEELKATPRAEGHPEILFVEYADTYHGYDDNSAKRVVNGWREGGNPSAARDTRERIRDFLARHGANAPVSKLKE